MPEKAYRTMTHAGVWNLVVGVLILVTGVTVGVMSLVYGGRLLKNKSEITF